MAPNADDNITKCEAEDDKFDAEEQKENTNKDTASVSQSTHHKNNETQTFLSLIKHYIKQTYILIWHDLSMDPAVRSSPYVDPPENEVKLSFVDKLNMRLLRIVLIAIHLGSLIGLYYCLTGRVKLYTILWTAVLDLFSVIGISAGAHRLWSHRAFKATWQLRTILMLFYTMCVQNSAHYWAQIHRVHHKFTDTEADPVNSNRGLMFSHIGWLLKYPRPEVVEQMKKIDMSDVESDKVIIFERKFYFPLVIIFAYLIPVFVPCYLWGEDVLMSHLVAGLFRYTYSLHAVFIINSVAHKYGMKPYDKNINAVDNTIYSILTSGEGWHNYHHVFPWDYRSAEFWDYKINFSTAFIDLFAKIGWAYDMKTVSSDLVRKRVKRTGDGRQHVNGWMGWAHDLITSNVDERKRGGVHVWGWDDPNMAQEDKELAEIRNAKID